MWGRLKKTWRFFKQQGEFNLTREESAVLTQVLCALKDRPNNDRNYNRAHLPLWDSCIEVAYPVLSESTLQDHMKSLADKLLHQTDWE